MAAAATGQINIQAFDELLAKLGDVYTRLGQIEKKIAAIEAKTITFKLGDDFKQGAKALHDISTAMKTLSGINTAGITQAADNLNKFLDAVSTAKVIGTKDTVDILNTFATALTKLGDVSVSGSLKGIDKLIGTLKPMFDELGKLLNSVSGISPATISATAQIFTALDPMFRGLSSIINTLSGLSLTGSFKVAGLFRSTVIPMFRALAELVAAASGVTPGSIKAVKEIFDELGVLVLELFTTLQTMQSLKFTNSKTVIGIFTTALPSLFRALAELIKAAEFVSPERINAINLLLREMRGFLPVIQGLLLDLNGIPKINRRVIEIFQVGVIDLLEALAKIMTASEKAKAGTLQEVPRLMLHAVEIIRAMQTLLESAGKHSFGDILAIRTLFGQIPKILEGLALIIAASADTQPQRLAQVTILMGAVGILLQTIVKTFSVDGILGIAKTLVLAITVLPTVRRLLNSIGLILETTAGVTPERLRELNTLMLVIGDMLLTLQKVTQRSGSFGDTVKVIATGLLVMPRVRNFLLAIRDVLQSASGLTPAGLTALSSTFLAIGDVLEIFGRIAAGAGLIRTIFNRLIAFPALMSVVSGVLNSVKKVIAVSSTVHPDALLGLGQVMRGLGDSLIAVAQIMDNISGLLGVGTGLLGTLGNMAALVVRLPALLLVLNVALGSVARIIRTLLRTTEGIDVARLRALGEFAQGVGVAMNGMADIFLRIQQSRLNTLNPIQIVKQMIGISIALSPIFTVIKKLVAATKDVPAGNLGDLGSFVQGIGKVMLATAQIFESITKAPSGIGNIIRMVFMLGQVTKPITNLLKDISKFSGKTDVKKIVNLKELILALSDVLATFSRTLSGDKDIDSTKIKGISEVIKSLFGIFKNIKIDEKAVKGLRELNEAMKLLSVGDIKKESIEVIRDLLAVLKTMGDIDTGKFNVKDIGAVFDQIGKSVNKLDISKIRAFAEIGEILRKMPDNVLTTGGSFEDLSDEFSEGAVDAAIKVKLLDAALAFLGDAIRALNPAAFFTAMVNGATAALRAVQGLFKGIQDGGEQMRQIGSDLVEFGQNIEQNFGISRLLGSNAFQAAAEFDALGTQLQVFGGLSEEAAASAQDFANVIGKDYPLSSNEALKATLDLIKAGQDLESVQKILPSAADLAALSDTQSIETSTGILIAATKTFKEFTDTIPAGFDNVATAADIVSAGADASTASVESLGQGLQNVGPLAGQFGLSLEQTVAILAQFNDAGIQGAEAGTQLKSLLTSFNSEPAQKEFRKLGVAFTNSDGSIRDFNDVLTDLNKKMNETRTVSFTTTKQLTGDEKLRGDAAEKAIRTAQRQRAILEGGLSSTALDPEKSAKKLEELSIIEANAANVLADVTGSQAEAQRITAEITRTEIQNVESLKKLGGSFGQAGLAVLLAQGEDGLDNFVAKMREVDPAADRARKMLDNFRGDITQLQGSIETLLTKAFLPLIEKVFRPFVKLGRFVVDSILEMDAATLEFITTGIALVSIFASVAAGLAIFAGGVLQVGGVVVTVIGAMGVAMTTLSFSAAGLATGFLLGLAAITAAITLILPVIALITAGFQALSTIFREDLGGAASAAARFFGNIRSVIELVGGAIGSFINLIGALVSGPQVGGLESLGERIAGFFTKISIALTNSKMNGALRRLRDLGKIFDSFFQTLTFGARGDAAAQKVTEQFEFLDGALELGGATTADLMDETRQRLIKEQAEMIADLANNNTVLRELFGGSLTTEDVEKFLVQFTVIAGKIRTALSDISGAFSDFFDNLGQDGFASAFATLGANLNDALGDLVSGLLEGLRTLFKIDLGQDLEQIFSEQGFKAGLKEGIKRTVNTLKRLILDNRDSIRDALVELFDFFFLSPINWGKFISDALGMEQLNGVFVELERIVRGIFGGIIDTIFNLMEGQDLSTALTNAFGPNIEPFLNILEALGNAADSIITIIGNLLSAIFGAGEGGGTPPLLDILTQIANGVSGFINLINDEILSKLAAGDVGGALAGIAGFGIGILQSIADSITNAISGVDLVATFSTVAGSIVVGFAEAVRAAFILIGEVLGIDVNGILATLDTTINNALTSVSAGGVGGAFSLVVGTLAGFLATAINGIFAGIGDLLNIDTSAIQTEISGALQTAIDSIQSLFLGEDGSGTIFTKIADILAKVGEAVTTLFGAFSVEDSITPKIDPLRLLLDQLGRFATLTIDTITGVFDGITEFLDTLSGFNAAEMTQFGLALSVIAGGVASFAAISAAGGLSGLLVTITGFVANAGTYAVGMLSFSGALTAMKTALVSFANTMIGKFAGFIAIVVIIKNFVEELGTFAEALQLFGSGDILGGFKKVIEGIINIITGIGTDILKLLGVDQINGFFLEDIPNLLNKISFIADAIFASINASVGKFGKAIQNVIDEVNFALIDLELRVARAILEAKGDPAKAQFDTITSNINVLTKFTGFELDDASSQELIDNVGTAFNTTLQAAIDDPNNVTAALLAEQIKIRARQGIDAISTQFADALVESEGNLASLPEWAKFFNLTGTVDEALNTVIATGDANVIQNFLDALLAQGVVLDDTLINNALADILTGFDPLSAAGYDSALAAMTGLKNSLITAGIDTAAIDAAILELETKRDDLLKRAGEALSGGEVDVTTGVNITPDPITMGPAADDGTGPIAFPGTDDFFGTGGKPVQITVPTDLALEPTGVAPVDPATVQAAIDASATDVSGVVPVSFDTSGLQNTEDVVAFDAAITGLTADVTLLVNQLRLVPTTSITVITELTNLTANITLFRDTNVPLIDEMSARFNAFEAAVKSALDATIARVGTLIIQFPALGLVANIALGLISVSFSIMAGAAAGAISITINNLEKLTVAIDDAADAAERLVANLTAAGNVGVGPGPGVPPSGARAGGGITLPGKKYLVTEGGKSELLQEGDKTYLLSGQMGKVIPLNDIPDLSSGRFSGMMNPNLMAAPVSSQQGGGGGIVINQGALNINVSGVDSQNEAALVDRIKTEVGQQQEKGNKRLADILRTGHRS